MKLGPLIINHQSIIGVIGLGYVGLPLIIRFSEEGFKTVGFDVDDSKVDMLNKGISYIKHIQPEKINSAIRQGFSATLDFSLISDIDIIIICVPPPISKPNVDAIPCN